jgi:hypothetical protein
MSGSTRLVAVREAAGAAVVCMASWLGLALGAGNVGLQRSISKGPLTLLEQPAAIVLVAVLAFATAALLVVNVRTARPGRLVVAVLLGDVVGAVVLAPLAVGELSPLNAPIVFLALAVLGVQPIAAFAGAWAGRQIAGEPVSA